MLLDAIAEEHNLPVEHHGTALGRRIARVWLDLPAWRNVHQQFGRMTDHSRIVRHHAGIVAIVCITQILDHQCHTELIDRSNTRDLIRRFNQLSIFLPFDLQRLVALRHVAVDASSHSWRKVNRVELSLEWFKTFEDFHLKLLKIFTEKLKRESSILRSSIFSMKIGNNKTVITCLQFIVELEVLDNGRN